MTKAFFILSFLILAYFNAFSQSNINDYKYVIVPNQYDFLKENDRYQINSLTKFLFNKYGYQAYMQDEEFPEDLHNNRCLGLTVDVINDSGFFKTKLRIELKDCDGIVVQSSKFGESREKEYAKAYNLALRDAFSTFQNMDYSYLPNETILSKAKQQSTTAVASAKEQEEIARLKGEIKALKEEKVEIVEDTLPGVESKKVEELLATTLDTKELKSELLYAQPIDNGFQIVDTSPKKVMVLKNSGVKDVFTVEGKKAIVYKKGDNWMYSESGDILKGVIINIKF
jgi:beta-phosphoglucomutase-like phosphatase (HAD superfamily)